MNEVKACRCCLATAGRLERLSDLMMKVFYNICGLKANPNDGQPQFVCVECKVQLRKALAIRRKSRRAHFALQQILTTKKIITKDDILRVNRHSAQLVSSYGPWQPDTSAVYSFVNVERHSVNQTSVQSENKGEIQSKDENDKTENLLQSFGFKAEEETIVYSISQVPATGNAGSGKVAIVQKRSPEVCNNSAILVNVKPDNYEELDRIEEEKIKQRKREEEEALRQIREGEDHIIDLEDDTFHDHETGNENTSEIDLTDVFKDLPEEPESDYSLSEPEPEFIKPSKPSKKEKETELIKKISSEVIRKATPTIKVYDGNLVGFIAFCESVVLNEKLLNVISLGKIRYLSLEEQLIYFEKRKEDQLYRSSQFRCSMCVKWFRTRDSLNDHVKEYHTAKTQIKCAICCGRFHEIEDLEVHQGWDHWYEYTCICGRIKYTLSEFLACCSKHDSSNISLEKDKTDQEEFFKQRFDKVLLTPDRWQETICDINVRCKRCGLEFKNRNQGMAHIRKEQDRLPFQVVVEHKCDVCGLVLKSLTAMEYHFDTCHAYLYRCKGCQLIFTRSSALRHTYLCKNKTFQLKLKSKPIEINYHHCVICGDSETTKALLYKHQLSTHRMIVVNSEGLGDGQYLCCKTYFTNESAYHTHLLNAGHDAAKHIPLACVQCKVRFADEAEMREHVHITPSRALEEHVSDDVEGFKCTECPRTFANPKQLRNHFFGKHYEYICEICGKKLSRQGFYQHKIIHEPQSNDGYECQICTKKTTFNTPNRFASHMLVQHTPYPYFCSICNKRFMDKYKCKLHIMKCHHPKPMLECIECKMNFGSPEKLHEHLINMHQIKASKVTNRKEIRKEFYWSLICYPHMRLDGSGIPVDVIKKCGLLLEDYNGETKIELPPEKVLDYFIYDESTVIGEVPDHQKWKRKKKRKQTPEQLKAKNEYQRIKRRMEKRLQSQLGQHQQQQENKMGADDDLNEDEEEKNEIVVSYVKNENGEFVVKLKHVQEENEVKSNINIEKKTVEAPNIELTDSNHRKRKPKSKNLDEVSKKRVKNKQTFVGTKTKPQTGKSLGIIDGIGDIVEEIDEKIEFTESKSSLSQLVESSGLFKEGKSNVSYKSDVPSSGFVLNKTKPRNTGSNMSGFSIVGENKNGLRTSGSNIIEPDVITSDSNTSGLRWGGENISGLRTSGSNVIETDLLKSDFNTSGLSSSSENMSGLRTSASITDSINRLKEGENIRFEVDAEELAENYEIVEVDGVQYAHIDGILYKLEYS